MRKGIREGEGGEVNLTGRAEAIGKLTGIKGRRRGSVGIIYSRKLETVPALRHNNPGLGM